MAVVLAVVLIGALQCRRVRSTRRAPWERRAGEEGPGITINSAYAVAGAAVDAPGGPEDGYYSSIRTAGNTYNDAAYAEIGIGAGGVGGVGWATGSTAPAAVYSTPSSGVGGPHDPGANTYLEPGIPIGIPTYDWAVPVPAWSTGAGPSTGTGTGHLSAVDGAYAEPVSMYAQVGYAQAGGATGGGTAGAASDATYEQPVPISTRGGFTRKPSVYDGFGSGHATADPDAEPSDDYLQVEGSTAA